MGLFDYGDLSDHFSLRPSDLGSITVTKGGVAEPHHRVHTPFVIQGFYAKGGLW